MIPTLNESGNIAAVLERTIASLSHCDVEWSVLVVDDCSTDNTAQIVEQYSNSNPRIRLVTRHGERGLAGAITFGWSQTDSDLVAVMDADLQHPPELLPKLIGEIKKGADIAIASRYVKPHSMDSWSPVRKVLSRMSTLASIPVQRRTTRVQDPMSGFFVVRRECVNDISFQKTGFKLLLEILAKGRINRVAEVPFVFAVRQNGTSKANMMTGLHYFALLLRLLATRRARAEPRV